MSAPMPAGRALGAPLLARDFEPTIFEFSAPGRHAASFRTTDLPAWTAEELVPESFRQAEPVALPEVSDATWSPISPASPIASIPSISGLTRSGHAR